MLTVPTPTLRTPNGPLRIKAQQRPKSPPASLRLVPLATGRSMPRVEIVARADRYVQDWLKLRSDIKITHCSLVWAFR